LNWTDNVDREVAILINPRFIENASQQDAIGQVLDDAVILHDTGELEGRASEMCVH
jgi:hypothetical protein